MADATQPVQGDPVDAVVAFPTEQEMLDSGLATAPEDAALLDVPVIEVVIQARDRVQARQVVPSSIEGEPDDVVITEFTIVRINAAGEYVGSPVGRIVPAEWDIELLTRAPLTLPNRRAMIEAALVDGSSRVLTGKRDVWMDEDGDLIDPGSIRSFSVVEGEGA